MKGNCEANRCLACTPAAVYKVQRWPGIQPSLSTPRIYKRRTFKPTSNCFRKNSRLYTTVEIITMLVLSFSQDQDFSTSNVHREPQDDSATRCADLQPRLGLLAPMYLEHRYSVNMSVIAQLRKRASAPSDRHDSTPILRLYHSSDPVYAPSDTISESLTNNPSVGLPSGLLSAPRSYAGRWYCHVCKNANSMAVSPMCYNCQHVRCAYCTVE